MFFINVVMVQLTEYLLWGHPQCDDYNKKLSMIQMIIINLQPIVLFMAVLYYNTLNDKTHKRLALLKSSLLVGYRKLLFKCC